MFKSIVASIAAIMMIAAVSFLTAETPEAAVNAVANVPVERIAGDQVADDLAPKVAGKFIVHEWGTFTTFSGSDGVFLDFRPLASQHSDLPPFVLDRASYASGAGFIKGRLRGKVRMETPVTYFYTDRVRTVDVRVDFPDGLLTEFYPPVREMLPPLDEKTMFNEGELIGKSSLSWGKVQLIPVDQLLPNVGDAKLQTQLTHAVIETLLPSAANDKHYVQARDTDAALIHVQGDGNVPRHYQQRNSYFEKFLFYRGVGKFQLPFSTTFSGNEIVVNNDGQLNVNSAILIDVDGDKIRATKIDQVRAGESLAFSATKEVTTDELAALVVDSLIDEGLYPKEAAAMVATWQQSWFTENGTRVLYMVPPSTTDELLPLHIDPAPQETLRVLVGRMEVMSPTAEQKMIESVVQSSKAREEFYTKFDRKAKNPKHYPIPAAIRDFGRMAEPALIRVSKISRDVVIQKEAERLINQFRAGA